MVGLALSVTGGLLDLGGRASKVVTAKGATAAPVSEGVTERHQG